MLNFRALSRLIQAGPAGPDRPQWRVFPAEYKLAIVEEYDRLIEPDAKGTPLRREVVYFSTIIEWRRTRDAGAVAASGPSCRSWWRRR